MIWETIKYASRIIIFFIIIFLIGCFVEFFILETTKVSGNSMQATFTNGEIVFVDKLSLLLSSPKRGQVVSVLDEEQASLFVKRIVGLPEEQVILIGGEVFIVSPEGLISKLSEPYLATGTTTLCSTGEADAEYAVIGPHEYFLIGDNRPYSIDSRQYGTVQRKNIVGVVRALPFQSLILFNLNRGTY